MLSKVLTTIVLTGSLIMAMSDTTSDAQTIRRNDQNLTVSELPTGIEKEGVIWTFRTGKGGAPAPTVLGFLSAAHAEPSDPSRHGAWWIQCTGPSSEYVCALKINAFGTLLELANATYSLE